MKFLIDLILTLLVRSFFLILKVLPHSFKHSLATKVVSLILRFFPRSKYVTYRNITLCFPEASNEFKEKVWLGMQKTLATNLIGFIKSPSLSKSDVNKYLDISDCSDVIEALANHQGPGALLLIPHFGCFELLAQLWSLYDRPFAILARGFNLKLLDAWWNSIREVHGNVIFGRKGGFKQIVSYLEKGTNVAILFDQNVKRSHSIFVDFFGHEASTTKTIGLASIRSSSKIIFAAMVPTGETKFKLIAKNITPPFERPGSLEEQIHATILDAHKHLEKCITEYPDQWFWLHRRFKTRPEGQKEDWYDPQKFPEKI